MGLQFLCTSNDVRGKVRAVNAPFTQMGKAAPLLISASSRQLRATCESLIRI